MTRVSVNFQEYWDKLEIFTELNPNKVYDASSYALVIFISNTKQSFTKYLQAIRELCDSQWHFEWNTKLKNPKQKTTKHKGVWAMNIFQQDSKHLHHDRHKTSNTIWLLNYKLHCLGRYSFSHLEWWESLKHKDSTTTRNHLLLAKDIYQKSKAMANINDELWFTSSNCDSFARTYIVKFGYFK